jgi:ferredoxin
MARLDKVRFGDFVREVSEDYRVYAPGSLGGSTVFLPVDPGGETDPCCGMTVLSPKGVFFPQSEALFEYENGRVRTLPEEGKPLLVWGMRGCDVRSLDLLDRVFGDAIQKPGDTRFQDPYWKNRYDGSVTFCTACNEPLSTCFCNWFGGGPHSGTGADVLVVDLGDALLFESRSEKGTALVQGLSCTEEATDDDRAMAAELASRADSAMAEPGSVEGLPTLLPETFDLDVWDGIAAKCLNCGACTFCCPTCHCFDVQDEGRSGKGRRLRIWDSCMFPVFTAEASGHNPRALSRDRVRQRFMHKFSYFPERYGEMLCTGCGRCISVCPVGLDVRDVVRLLGDCGSGG